MTEARQDDILHCHMQNYNHRMQTYSPKTYKARILFLQRQPVKPSSQTASHKAQDLGWREHEYIEKSCERHSGRYLRFPFNKV